MRTPLREAIDIIEDMDMRAAIKLDDYLFRHSYATERELKLITDMREILDEFKAVQKALIQAKKTYET